MSEDIGNFTQDYIAEVVREVGVPENAGVEPLQRFVKQVSDLIALRLSVGEGDGLTVLLQSDALESDVEGRGWARIPLLRNGNDAISCRILLSNAALAVGYAVNDDEAAADQLEAVSKAGLGRHPAIVIDWRGDLPKATLFGSGVDNIDDVQDVNLADDTILTADLKDVLDDFYRKRLRTPQLVVQGGSQRIWGQAVKGIPSENVEKRIQGVLMNYLFASYPRFHMRAEVNNEEGRLDLIIFAKQYDQKGDKIVKPLWILELKALTDRDSSGNSISPAVTKGAIEKGLSQAISYRDSEHANHAALCCFDMRSEDFTDAVVFAEIQQEANDNHVSLWRWFMLRSSESSRDESRAKRLAIKRAEA